MSEKQMFEIEYTVRLHETDSDEKVVPYIEVGECIEAPGIIQIRSTSEVQIRTTSEESKRYFGNIDISLSHEKAIQLGHAIIHIAKMMKND